MDQIWLVMELCDGGSVAELVQGLKKTSSIGYLKEVEIAYILSEVLNFLCINLIRIQTNDLVVFKF